GCPLFVLTPFWPEAKEAGLWQDEIAKLWQRIDAAGLHDIVVPDSPLWDERTLFHHDEHPSERGREIWSRTVIAKLMERGLPGSGGRVDGQANGPGAPGIWRILVLWTSLPRGCGRRAMRA